MGKGTRLGSFYNELKCLVGSLEVSFKGIKSKEEKLSLEKKN